MRIAFRQLLRGKVAGAPIVHIANREEEVARRYTQDYSAFAIHQNVAAGDFGISAEAALPKVIADDNSLGLRSVFLMGPNAANDRLDLQHFEEVWRHRTSKRLLGRLIASEAGRLVAQCGHVREHMILCAPIDVVRRSG